PAGAGDRPAPRYDARPQRAETLLRLLAEALHSPLLSPGAGLESERLLLAGHGRADFGGEVLRLLGQALAQRVAHVAAYLDVLADDGHCLVQHVLDAALAVRVAEEPLLEQAIVLVELVELPGDDLVQHRLGLA